VTTSHGVTAAGSTLADPTGPLAGIRIVEVAQWVFVPGATAMLADWGADVIKVEHPVYGDAVRGLNQKNRPSHPASSHNTQHSNRNKRSIGIDLHNEAGHESLMRIVQTADVFVTNFLPEARRALRIDVDDVRASNPSIVYARGSGVGPRGDEVERGGYDYATFWGRAGVGNAFHNPALPYPVAGNASFGDLISSPVLAAGISAAIVKRLQTGEPSVVDVSLLGVGAWVMAGDIVTTALGRPQPSVALAPHDRPANPMVNIYKTKDGRFMTIVSLQSERSWPDFCTRIGRPDLLADPRFADAEQRAHHCAECVAEIDKAFADRTLDEWRSALAGADFVWEPMQTPGEVGRDPQILANRYLATVETLGDDTITPILVASPVQFEEQSCTPLRRAPYVGEHTEEILVEAGLTWDDIGRLKTEGAVS
jgi:crotonobetainyl-CoA:carnitine CoA-transferase CaiB-like acyl-CoA transferase